MEEDINPNVPVKRSYDKIYLYIIIVVLCILVFYFAWLALGKSTEPVSQTPAPDTKAMAEDIKRQFEELEPPASVEPTVEPPEVVTEPESAPALVPAAAAVAEEVN